MSSHPFIDFLQNNSHNAFLKKVFQLINESQFQNLITFFSFSKANLLLLSENGLLSYLFNLDKIDESDIISSLILSIFNSLQKYSYNYLNLLSSEDKINACAKRTASVIASIFIDEEIPQYSIENPLSPINAILNRDDPFLLEECLYTVPALFSTSKNMGMDILLYCIVYEKSNILHNFFIFIDYFELKPDDLSDAVNAWKFRYESKQMPVFMQMHYDWLLSSEAISLIPHNQKINQAISQSDSFWFIESPSFTMENLIVEATNLKNAISSKIDDDIISHSGLLDGSDNTVLTNLPMFLMKYSEAIVHDQISLGIGPIQIGSGEGTGMFKSLIGKYFQVLEKQQIFQRSDNSQYSLPTNENLPPEKVKEYCTIFYGLGVVYLKLILSGIAFDFSVVPHIWVFQSMLNQLHTEGNMDDLMKDKFIQEAFQYDKDVSSNIIANDQELSIEKESSMNSNEKRDELQKQFINSLIDVNNRHLFLNMIGKGFRLEFDENILPYEVQDSMKKAKDELKDKLKYLSQTTPEALRILLVPDTRVSKQRILEMFDIELYKSMARYENDPLYSDEKFTSKNPKIKRKMERTREIVRNCLAKWADDPDPTMISKFLEYTLGVKKLCALNNEHWVIKVTEKVSYDRNSRSRSPENIRIIRVWSCSNEIMVSIFESEQEFEEKFLEFYNMNKAQGSHLYDGNA